MKTKIWISLIGLLLAVCIALSLWLFRPGQPADSVTVFSDGQKLYVLSLHTDQTLTVRSANGTNIITVQNGKIAVTQADCPDGHCMARGFCDSGAQIVCLPNRLVIQFSGSHTIDGIAG